MKKNIFVFTLLLLTLTVCGQGICFQDLTIEQAVEQAKKENKHVFIDFYTDWCGPCKLMAAQVFPMKEMGDYFNPKYICIKQNAGKGGDGEKSAEKFGVKAYPTFVILDGNGELVHMFAGGVPDVSFIDKVEEAFQPDKAFGALKKRYDAGERTPKFVASYLEALQNTHTAANINDLVEEFYKSTNTEDKICAECLFLFDSYARVGSEKDEFLTEHRDRFREVAGREQVDDIFKRKYVAYYGQVILGYDRTTNQETLEKTNEKFASLGLPVNPLYSLLQAAAAAKLNGKGATELYETTKTVATKMETKDLDMYLYYTIIGLKDLFNDTQKEDLLALMNSESTKGYVKRSIK